MEQNPNTESLITLIKARGWQNATHTLLDIVEPIAPLVSQLLWVVQPVSSVFNVQDLIGDLANTLDTPHGIDHLRKELDDQ